MGAGVLTEERSLNRSERRRRRRADDVALREYVRSLSSRELRRLAGRRHPASTLAASAVSWALVPGALGAAPAGADPVSADPPSIAGVPRPATPSLPPLVLVFPDSESIAGVPRAPVELGGPPVAAPAPAPVPEAPMPSLFPDPPTLAGPPRPALTVPPLPDAEAEDAAPVPGSVPFFTDPASIAGTPRPSLLDAPVVAPPQPIEFFVGYGNGLGGEVAVIWGPGWTDFQASALFGLYLGGKAGAEVAPDRAPGATWELKGSGTFFNLVRGEAGVTAPFQLDALYGVAKGGIGTVYGGGRWELLPDFQFIDDRAGAQVPVGPRLSAGLAGAAGLRVTSDRINLYDTVMRLYNQALEQLGLGSAPPADPNAPVAPLVPPTDFPLLDAPLPFTILDPLAPWPDPPAPADPASTADPAPAPAQSPDATPPPLADPVAVPDPAAPTPDATDTAAPTLAPPDPVGVPAPDPAPTPDAADTAAPTLAPPDPVAVPAPDPAPTPDPTGTAAPTLAPPDRVAVPDPAPAPAPVDTPDITPPAPETPVFEPGAGGAGVDPVPDAAADLAAPAPEPAAYEPVAIDNPSTTMDDTGSAFSVTPSYTPTVDTSTYSDLSASTTSYSAAPSLSYDSPGVDAAYEPYVAEPMAQLEPIAPLDTAPIAGRDSYDPLDTGFDTGLDSFDSGVDSFDTGLDMSFDTGSSFDSGGGSFSSGGGE